MVKFREVELVEAFITTEAKDFNLTETGRTKFVAFRMTEIQEQLKKIPYADYIVLKSITNMGLESRTLKVSAEDKWCDGTNVLIILCSCGKDDHWGWTEVVVADKSNRG